MKKIDKITGKIGLVLLAVVVAMTFNSCDPDETQTVVNFTNLIWEDNFDGSGAPDASKWTITTGDGTAQGIPGWGNNELQTYTGRPENIAVEDGMLKITARQEQLDGRNYTSARINTSASGQLQQAYGRFEARIKLPWGQGLWPAFWMLGTNSANWPQRGEIDIMENRGDQPTIIKGSVHGPGYSAGQSVGKDYELTNGRYDTEFHIFGVEWGPNYINYYVDDVLYQQITPEDVTGEWVFNDNPFYMILNVAVGGAFSGNPNSETVFPQTMYVDWVRVYAPN